MIQILVNKKEDQILKEIYEVNCMGKYLVRYLEIYDNVNEPYYLVDSIKLTINEETVSGITIKDLKDMFKLRKKDPEMFEPYDIRKKHAKFFEEKLGIKLDCKKYFYSIQARLVNEEELND